VDSEECIKGEPVKKKVKRKGPSLRSHSQVEKQVLQDWAPSNDEEEEGFLK
jgi:hypothetical protein